MLRSTYHRLADANTQRECSEEEIQRYALMFENSIKNSEKIKDKIDNIKQKLDENSEKK